MELWDAYDMNLNKIKDKTLETYVKEATEKVICDVIDKNIKDIFAKKVAEML